MLKTICQIVFLTMFFVNAFSLEIRRAEVLSIPKNIHSNVAYANSKLYYFDYRKGIIEYSLKNSTENILVPVKKCHVPIRYFDAKGESVELVFDKIKLFHANTTFH